MASLIVSASPMGRRQSLSQDGTGGSNPASSSGEATANLHRTALPRASNLPFQPVSGSQTSKFIGSAAPGSAELRGPPSCSGSEAVAAATIPPADLFAEWLPDQGAPKRRYW